MIRYDTIRYDTIRYDTIRYDTILYNISESMLSKPHSKGQRLCGRLPASGSFLSERDGKS